MEQPLKHIKLRLTCTLKDIKAGEIVTVTARGDVPVDPFWQRRLRDHGVVRVPAPTTEEGDKDNE